MGSTTEDQEAARRKALTETLQRAEEAAKAKRYGEAAGICNDLLEGTPNFPPALALLGAIAGHRGDIPGAIEMLERAVKGDASAASWHSNLSGLYRLQYRLDEALTSALTAVKLRADAARYHVNLGKALIDCNRREEAIGSFMTALAREKNNAEAHLAIGQILLARGEFRPGWVEYEWRNQLDQAKGMLPPMATPPWNGMVLPNGRLLLVADQGYGDTIQFCRYIPLVAGRAREVVLGCSPDLLPLLRSIPGVASHYTKWNEIPPHVSYCLLSSLPGIVGTEIDTIPGPHPYLAADSVAVGEWAKRLGERLPAGKLRVGLVWAGRPTHPNDSRRSIPLAMLAPLAALDNIALVSLQKVLPARDQAARAAFTTMIDVADELTDFGQTAAVVANLDLVVTVDSAAGHLAGAIGRPVWVMMPTPSDWRWMIDRTDSPWYPTMRMFRQPKPGDWATVVAQVTQALAGMPKSRARHATPRTREAAAPV
jgi:Flp pilus assembly protein TadD